ncbi:MAG: DEAD/DEAH box helicase family protein [Verrucomicrobia bacterium]|nr:DEAD/DEAH box helicase family protein [Verrucomicrobiota bacterium]
MPFDFSKLKPQPKEQRLTDPIALFQRLRISDTSINDLWLAQGDALRGWNDNRTEKDISISLNTGAGKTLVGLLIGQSLVNELRSNVIYACSSIQLVEQTAKNAEGFHGAPVAADQSFAERFFVHCKRTKAWH